MRTIGLALILVVAACGEKAPNPLGGPVNTGGKPDVNKTEGTVSTGGPVNAGPPASGGTVNTAAAPTGGAVNANPPATGGPVNGGGTPSDPRKK